MSRKPPKPKALTVAGVMSGTSADGIDVAIVRVSPGRSEGVPPRVKLLAHSGFAYPPEVRAVVLRVMQSVVEGSDETVSVPDLARLNWRLGALYADAVETTLAKAGDRLDLIGMHGQTIYHQGTPRPFLGEPVAATWQIGEAAVLAERLRVPVVSDLRAPDLAADGQAAPLVPMFDLCLFASPTRNRVLLNLGGIANFTAIPAGAGADGLLAFDTGPASMAIDLLMTRLCGREFDAGGEVAASGRVVPDVVERVLSEPYFAAHPPKSCGREEFGAGFADRLHAFCMASGASDADTIATATEITVRSVLDAYRRFAGTYMGQRAPHARATEVIAAGGGVHNRWMMRRLGEGFKALGVRLKTVDEFGFPAEAKEAAAFALLAWLRWFELPGNVPAATGARRAVVLGKVSWGA